ncbi:hypothetical protein [Cellulosilyticum sp. WCF-2]|uniref:hypothetical protein n=1 Tax=Cellulosilyticum sp. WCF-2 TaxID=2497860 RepID=UPI000F8E00EA|nr:hypothetical protein [Cellulosilyticum sp. WCF-2]QEH69737.1 hypothetical protein EKH84_15580 [Cellulosilyticum sp. WCF-2]
MDEIQEMIDTVADLNIGDKAKNKVLDMLNKVEEIIEEKDSTIRCLNKTIDAFKAEKDKLQYEVAERRQENVQLKEDNNVLKVKFETSESVICDNKMLIVNQQSRIEKLQAIVTDVVNKI